MAITLTSPRVEVGKMQMGQNGRHICFGQFAFSTTDITGVIPMPLKQIHSIVFSYAQAAAATDQVSVDATANSARSASVGGVINVKTGLLDIVRAAGTTSGLKVNFIAIGVTT